MYVHVSAAGDQSGVAREAVRSVRELFVAKSQGEPSWAVEALVDRVRNELRPTSAYDAGWSADLEELQGAVERWLAAWGDAVVEEVERARVRSALAGLGAA